MPRTNYSAVRASARSLFRIRRSNEVDAVDLYFLSSPLFFYFAGRDCICPLVQIALLVVIAHRKLFEREIFFFYVMRNKYSHTKRQNDTNAEAQLLDYEWNDNLMIINPM